MNGDEFDSVEVTAPSPSQHSRLATTAQVVSALAAIIGAAVSIWRGCPPYVLSIFGGAAFIFILTVIYAPAYARYQRWVRRRGDKKVAQRNWPIFKNYVRRFGEFVDTRTNNTVHGIITNDLPHPVQAQLSQRIVPIHTYYQFWYFFNQRIARASLTVSELKYAVTEFENILGQYYLHCLCPVFQMMSAELRQVLHEQSKAKLNAFQQKYGHFIEEYREFLKQLSQSRGLEALDRYFEYPPPL